MRSETGRYLFDLYKQRRRDKKIDSLRSFAVELEISASLLSYILNGRRLVTHATLEKFCEKLKFSQQTRKQIFAMLERDLLAKKKQKAK